MSDLLTDFFYFALEESQGFWNFVRCVFFVGEFISALFVICDLMRVLGGRFPHLLVVVAANAIYLRAIYRPNWLHTLSLLRGLQPEL